MSELLQDFAAEQRELLEMARHTLYRAHKAEYPEYIDLGEIEEALGKLNFHLGVHIPAGTAEYRVVIIFPNDDVLRATITNCVSGLDVSADEFRDMLTGRFMAGKATLTTDINGNILSDNPWNKSWKSDGDWIIEQAITPPSLTVGSKLE